MYLCKRKDGSYIPYDNADHEASAKIPVGETVKATKARNLLFHKKSFALLNTGFENQDKIQSFEVYRKLITIRAGFFEWAGEYAIPHSISFDKMNAETFEKWYNATLDVIVGDSGEGVRDEVEKFY